MGTWKVAVDGAHLVDDDGDAACGTTIDFVESVSYALRPAFLKNCAECVVADAKTRPTSPQDAARRARAAAYLAARK